MPLAFASWNCTSNNVHISWELVVFQNTYFLNDFSFNSHITILLPGWHICHMLLCSFCQTVHEQVSFLSSAVSSSMIIIISVVRLASYPAFVRGRNTTVMCSISNKRKKSVWQCQQRSPCQDQPCLLPQESQLYWRTGNHLFYYSA